MRQLGLVIAFLVFGATEASAQLGAAVLPSTR
jgi:hypothetical protein